MRKPRLARYQAKAALQTLLAQVKVAVKNGAEIALGGKRIERTGAYMEPTILTHVTEKKSGVS